MLDVADPYSRPELAACLERAGREVGDFFAGLPPEIFLARPAPEAWSPAEHLWHLVLSRRAVARALAIPRPLLWLRFGRSGRGSRRYVEVRDSYRAALAAGGRATGEYVPRPGVPGDPVAAQRRAVDAWAAVGTALLTNLEGWDEDSLDRIRLPHPLLGKLPVREILLFTLYHDQHHWAAVRRRTEPAAAIPLAGE